MSNAVGTLIALCAAALVSFGCAAGSGGNPGIAGSPDTPCETPEPMPTESVATFVDPTPPTPQPMPAPKPMPAPEPMPQPTARASGTTDSGSRYVTASDPMGRLAVETDPMATVGRRPTTPAPAAAAAFPAPAPQAATPPATSKKRREIKSSADLPPPGR